MASMKKRLGYHILIDFFGVSEDKLRNKKQLMKVLHSALKKAGFNIICEEVGYQFPNGGKGVTGFVLLAQSHAAFHSYPEYQYIAFDIYSCGTHDPRPVVEAMKEYLCPEKVKHFSRQRGVILKKKMPLI